MPVPVIEEDLEEGWYIVRPEGSDGWQALSQAFSTFVGAYVGLSSNPARYPGDTYIRRWTGKEWWVPQSEE